MYVRAICSVRVYVYTVWTAAKFSFLQNLEDELR